MKHSKNMKELESRLPKTLSASTQQFCAGGEQSFVHILGLGFGQPWHSCRSLMCFHEEFILIFNFFFFCSELKIVWWFNCHSERKSLLALLSVGRSFHTFVLGTVESHMKNGHFKNQLSFSKPVENQLCANSIWLGLSDYINCTGMVMYFDF